MSFEIVLSATLREESGEVQPVGGPFRRGRFSFSDHPDDPGGRTMMGIIQREYDDFRAARKQPAMDVAMITDHEVLDIYRDSYWTPVQGDALPPGIDLAVFDFGVNSGPVTAIKKLQSALGVVPDGHIGVRTKRALAECDPVSVVTSLMQLRRDYCRSLRNYPSFKNGWEKRWDRIEKIALRMATVPDAPQPMPVTERVIDPPVAVKAIDAPPSRMSQSDTGNAALIGGGSGLASIGTSVAKAAGELMSAGKPVSFPVLIVEAASKELFWLGIAAFASCVFIWSERRRKLRMHHH
jgi:lysozyme family protein